MAKPDWLPSEQFFTKMTIGQRLRWLLEYREITQTEVAYRIGVTQAAISNIVTDSSRKPSAPTLLALADYLQIRPAWLLDGRGNPFAGATVVKDEDQAELLALWNSLPDEGRKALMSTAKALSSARKR